MPRRFALLFLLSVASACHRVTPAEAPAKSAAPAEAVMTPAAITAERRREVAFFLR